MVLIFSSRYVAARPSKRVNTSFSRRTMSSGAIASDMGVNSAMSAKRAQQEPFGALAFHCQDFGSAIAFTNEVVGRK
jgi:hypothetical protein